MGVGNYMYQEDVTYSEINIQGLFFFCININLPKSIGI